MTVLLEYMMHLLLIHFCSGVSFPTIFGVPIMYGALLQAVKGKGNPGIASYAPANII